MKEKEDKVWSTEEYGSVENMFLVMRQEWETSHPIYAWLDRKLGGIGGYAPHYAITHPWKILENWAYEIKWAWQRVFRGWDDRVTWGIDQYLAEVLPLWIDSLIKHHNGVPMCAYEEDDYNPETGKFKEGSDEIANEKYESALKKIADGFRAYSIITEKALYGEKAKPYQEKFDEGFDLFKKYFNALWD